MIKLAIDLGSYVTKIYRIGSGIVLSEPSCVALNTETGEIKAVGKEAKEMLGKTAEFTSIHFPVVSGEIRDERGAVMMLRQFLQRIEIKLSQLQSVQAVFCVPCGIKSEECAKYYNVADKCGLEKISFVEAPVLSIIGVNAPVSDSAPAFNLDIGGGTSNMAVASLDGIIVGISINVGGVDIDRSIAESVASSFNMKIGPLTCERLKNEVGSLISGDGKCKVVNGRDLSTGKPISKNISSEDLYSAIKSKVDIIIKYAEMVLKKIPVEVSASVCRSGIFLTGGVSAMPGLADYISRYFSIPVRCDEDSRLAVVLGGGRAAEDAEMLKKIRIDF